MWPFLKIALVFTAMLFGIRKKFGLARSILAGSVLLGFLFGFGPLSWGKAAALALIDPDTIFLAVIVALILILSDLFETTGQAARLMEAMRGILTKPRLRLVFFPILIGLLPMPGGAVFSAPMVKNLSKDLDVTDVDRAVINYWFRHIWEMGWPLYPGFLLSAALSGVPVAKLSLMACPAMVVCLLLGWRFLLRNKIETLSTFVEDSQLVVSSFSTRSVLSHAAPLLTAIIGGIGLQAGIGFVDPAANAEIGIVVGLVASIVVCVRQNKVTTEQIANIFRKKHLYTMLGVIASIFIFKDVMRQAGVVEAMSSSAGADVALWFTAIILPFIVGVVAGIALAYVGASLPLLLGLLQGLGMSSQIPEYTILLLICGFAGIMVSPIHICFLLTCQYFNVEISNAWRRIAIPSMGLFVFGIVYFLLLRAL
ncbi:DUF401 family protein [Desulfovibrio inopinatus]|uniref:DUF401 family protein n=1 Tax=Desulfovibrio inopinatus TaxID=102109 RepID=UPI0003FFD632|nr:DUF401 family protein [Desulfovibrio inopinatus]